MRNQHIENNIGPIENSLEIMCKETHNKILPACHVKTTFCQFNHVVALNTLAP